MPTSDWTAIGAAKAEADKAVTLSMVAITIRIFVLHLVLCCSNAES
jgi:hypothetical protein